MNSINKDDLYSILVFLNVNELKQVSKVNSYMKKVVNTNKKLILKSYIISIWGLQIYNMLPQKDIEIFLNYNLNNLMRILEIFYKKIIIDKINIKCKLMIEIYDVVYTICNCNDINREIIFDHRTKTIKNIIGDKIIKKDDKYINFIINSTSYLNRFCYFLNNSMMLHIKNEKIIDIINNYQ